MLVTTPLKVRVTFVHYCWVSFSPPHMNQRQLDGEGEFPPFRALRELFEASVRPCRFTAVHEPTTAENGQLFRSNPWRAE